MSSVNLKTRSGNNIVITFDGVQIGAVRSVSLDEDYSPEPVTGIGDAKAIEYVPGMARYSLSVQNVALAVASMRSAGLVPENSDAALQGLVFDILVYSKIDGSLLRKYSGVSYASGRIDVETNKIVMSSGQFNALDVSGIGL